MAYPVLIIGKSGSGKSASMRNLDPSKTGVVSVLGKPLPFRGELRTRVTSDYNKVASSIVNSTSPIIVIDDAGYLITNQFMANHASGGAGNSIFTLYNQIGDNFWSLIKTASDMKSNKRIYFIMHEDKSDQGDVKPKTIGKLLDEKVCIEGMFSICLRCMLVDGRHVFTTQTNGYDIAKSPMGMFATNEIDNDLALVDKAICEYYGIDDKAKSKEAKTA